MFLYEVFFYSRLEMYLRLLISLPLSADWIDSLPKVDLEVTVPTPNLECPICTDRYLETPEESPIDEESREIPLRLPCNHILGAACIGRLA